MTIVLDTNVLSEALKPSPAQAVLGWLARQERESVVTTAIAQAEILYGMEMLPAGNRRARLRAAVERLFAEEFQERILTFDVEAALIYPKIVAGREAMGRPISQFDAVIASTAAHGRLRSPRGTPSISKTAASRSSIPGVNRRSEHKQHCPPPRRV